MITILAFILLLGILVIVHESGHFIAARMCGVQVEKFSFGFGPKIFAKTVGETEYRISLIPLGGYVKMLGENPEEQENDLDSGKTFSGKKWWQKVFIAFNGPFFNLLLAIIILSLTYMIGLKTYDLQPIVGNVSSSQTDLHQLKPHDEILSIDGEKIDGWISIIELWRDSYKPIHAVKILRDGEVITLNMKNFDFKLWLTDVESYAPPIIGEVYYGLPAYQSGLKKGDEILTINGKNVNSWSEMRGIITANSDTELRLSVRRDSEKLSIIVTPQLNPGEKEEAGIIGITQKLELVNIERYGVFKAIEYGTITTFTVVVGYYKGLFKLIKRPSEAGKNVGGPIMIAAMTKQQTEQGLTSYLSFMAMISIILMVMNLLPMPVLDGGQILFSVIEGIMRKPLKIGLQKIFQQVGIAVLILLMFFAFYNDISRYITRQLSLKNNVTTVPENQKK
ncbi:MAG: RIP metalloprotease RseP [Candidatus Cloacimonadota bacterium]|nr:RIP metalloprotease RseP [Candidatus Cloacimonadota bacterium]